MTKRGLLLVIGILGATLPVSGVPVATPTPGQETLSQVVSRLAQAWVDGDLEAIGSLMASAGVHVRLGAQDFHVLEKRQALATIRGLLRQMEGRGFEVTRVSELNGEPSRGISEVEWEAVDRGSRELVQRTLFMGFILEAGAWRVEDLWVLR
ncbi:MAG: hypothetical protein BMS9Abin29_2078 [Gemmatimonadota bacterium]|nr:MAG: hypothetical protein BMS9Abin29_2078 [Gemmatimonadota bacterium]